MESNPEKWENYELFRGVPVEMTYSGKTARKSFLFNKWIREKGYGEVYGGESGIKFADDVRYSFDLGWNESALPEDEIPAKSLSLMVEIISESNDANNLLTKVEDYLTFGAKQVWLVYPKRKTLQIYFPDNTARTFHSEDTIVPGDWMKGFSFKVQDLFL